MKAMTGSIMGECGMIDKALADNVERIGGFDHESCHSQD
jgi:hypothetical protein